MIEDILAKTDYAAGDGWYRVGSEMDGFFPLIDFQRGNVVVSVKTTYALTQESFRRMLKHVQDLQLKEPLVAGQKAVRKLDIRFPPGMMEKVMNSRLYEALKIRAKKNGVILIIGEFLG